VKRKISLLNVKQPLEEGYQQKSGFCTGFVHMGVFTSF
jgi:hypothetical protein